MAVVCYFTSDPIFVARRLRNLRLIAAEARRIRDDAELPNDSLCGHFSDEALHQVQHCELRLRSAADKGVLRIYLNSSDRLIPAAVEILRKRGYVVVEKLPPLEDGTGYWATVTVPDEDESEITPENVTWKIGDTVRIRATPPVPDGKLPHWASPMNNCCGQVGMITEIVNSGNLKVQVKDWYFRPEWVEKV